MKANFILDWVSRNWNPMSVCFYFHLMSHWFFMVASNCFFFSLYFFFFSFFPSLSTVPGVTARSHSGTRGRIQISILRDWLVTWGSTNPTCANPAAWRVRPCGFAMFREWPLPVSRAVLVFSYVGSFYFLTLVNETRNAVLLVDCFVSLSGLFAAVPGVQYPGIIRFVLEFNFTIS